MLGRWNTLAKHYVRLPGAPARDDAAAIAFMKSRTQPIAATGAAKAVEETA